MITNYIAGADAVLLCYDITNYESFANLEDWYRLVLRTFQLGSMPFVALVGNKSKKRNALLFIFSNACVEEFFMFICVDRRLKASYSGSLCAAQ